MDCFAYYKHSFPKIHYSSIPQEKTLLWAPPAPTQFVKTLPFLAWLKHTPAKEAPASQPLLSAQPFPPLCSALYIKIEIQITPEQEWFDSGGFQETLGTEVVNCSILRQPGTSCRYFPHSFDFAKLKLPMLKIFHSGHLLQDLFTFLPKRSLPISETALTKTCCSATLITRSKGNFGSSVYVRAVSKFVKSSDPLLLLFFFKLFVSLISCWVGLGDFFVSCCWGFVWGLCFGFLLCLSMV